MSDPSIQKYESMQGIYMFFIKKKNTSLLA